MTKINVHEAKTHLSRYLQKVEEGETILLCRHGVPVARITPLQKKSKKLEFGLAKGMGKVTESFFEPLTEKELPGMGLSE